MKLAFFVVAMVATIAWNQAEGASFEEDDENEDFSEFSHSRVRRADTLSCTAGQTKIYTPLIYDYNATSSFCSSIVGKLANDYYNLVFRTECQRWLGLSSLPEQVGLSGLNTCTRWSANNTAAYQMAVCCLATTTAVRCFTVNDLQETSNYGANYHGTVQTCSSSQMCMTRYTFQGTGCTVAKQYLAKGCVAASDCLTAASSPMCADYATTPVCTTCCNSTFCNYAVNDTLTKKPGSCSTSNATGAPQTCIPNPCQNSGKCQSLSCFCRIGWSGSFCTQQMPLCAVNQCLNGGTCFDYGSNGFRCYCPMGYIGDTCEFRSVLTCHVGDRAYRLTSEGLPVSDTCDQMASEAVGASGTYIDDCINQMKWSDGTTFVQGSNGQIDYMIQFEPQYCRRGQSLSWYRLQMCCPSCMSIPCQHGGWCIDKQETLEYVCVCPVGYTGVNCEHQVSVCVISGEPHYKSFDNQKIDYQGVCKHLLVEPSSDYTGSDQFHIYLRNEHRNENYHVSYPKDLIIDICDDHVEFLRDATSLAVVPVIVKVNGTVVKPPYQGGCYTINYSGRFVRLDSTFGLAAQFDGSFMVTIQVPDNYISLTHGICGNNNGVADDDLITCDGEYVGGGSALDPGALIGNSCVVSDDSHPDQSNCSVPERDTTCSPDKESQYSDVLSCGALIDETGPFATCIGLLGLDIATDFFSSCVYDACFADESLICDSFAVFAYQCFVLGVTVDWRDALDCPLSCPVGMIASQSTKPCLATCDNPHAPDYCNHPSYEGCVCPPGGLLFDGQCAPCCPYVDNDGTVHLAGSQWTAPNCTTFTYPPTTTDGLCHSTVSVLVPSCASDETCQNGQCVITTTPTTPSSTTTATTPTTPTTTPTTTTTTAPAPECLSVDGAFCDYGPWSDCVDFVQTRTRSCGCPAAGCFACNITSPTMSECVSCVQTLADGTPISCPAHQCSGPSTESRVCCPPFNPQVSCQTCNFSMNPLGYVADPCNCSYFYQCVWANSNWTAYHQPCPACLCWNSTTLTCSNLANPSIPLTDPSCRPANNGTTSTKDAYCSMYYPASDASHYIWVTGTRNYTMPCPTGTLFDVVTCHCLQSSLSYNSSGRLFCLDFDNSYLMNGLFVSMANVIIGDFLFRGQSAYFNGNSAWIELPALSNVQFNKFGISLYFKRIGTDLYSQGLVFNGDCKQLGSIRIQSIDQNDVSVKVSTINQNITIPNKPASYNTWHHVALSYDGMFIKLYIDTVLVSTQVATGPTVLAGCPLTLGRNYINDQIGLSGGWFNGYMDNICFYNHAFTASQVNDLYNFIQA